MSTMVVLGGGIGGLSAAFELKNELGDGVAADTTA